MSRFWIAAIMLAACEPQTLPGGRDSLDGSVAPEFHTFLDLHAGVIARTCSPNPGVCHASESYPDLSTSATTLLAIAAPCNLDPPDVTRGFDACERRADRFVTRAFTEELAWLVPDRPQLILRRPAEVTGTFELSIERAGELIFSELMIEVAAGSRTATVSEMIGQLIPGDPNQNGVFGAELGENTQLIAPGRLDRSYLWGRITGTMPGTRMPLANQPLSFDEYVAIACWIEQLANTPVPSVEDVIDYDRCAFAKAPIDYTMEAR